MNSDATVDDNHAAWEPQKDWKTWSPKEWLLPIVVSPTPAEWN